MEGTKIYSLLRSLSNQEFKELGSFLNSSFFNYSKKIKTLYKVLRNYYPDFENPELITEKIYTALYSDGHYNASKIRDLFKAMFNQTKSYLSYLRFRRDKFESELYFLEELNDRTLGKIFYPEINEIIQVLEKNDLKDEDYYYMLYKVENLKTEYLENNQVVVQGEKYYEDIRRGVDYLTNFMLISLLKKYFKILNTRRIFNIKTEDDGIENIINYLIKNFVNARDIPLVNVIHEFLKLYTEDVSIDTIESLKKINKCNREHLKKEDYKDFFIELYNYCKRRQSEGSKEFGDLSVELMKEMLEEDIFLEKDGYMLDHTFVNLASSAFRVNDMDWAAKFINKYAEKVSPDKRESAFNFTYALYYFLTGKEDPSIRSVNYNNALEHLSKVKIEYSYYYARVNNLYLMLYYEMNDYIHAEPIIDSYKHYLKTNKELPAHIKLRYSNFLSSLSKLFHLRENNSEGKFEKFREEILSNNMVEYRSWIVEKLQELEKAVEV